MLSNKTQSEEKLVNNPEYYKYIFKKTEKVVCAVFYILDDRGHAKDNPIIIKDIEKVALKTIDTALRSLQSHGSSSATILSELRYDLLSLQTKLRILHASHLLTADILHVFIDETDSVIRTLKNYIEYGDTSALFSDTDASDGPANRVVAKRPVSSVSGGASRTASTQAGNGTNQPDRKTRIAEVLKSKPNASIKDISDIVTDCSEKTIQRELMSMINDKIVEKKGQRRWTTYSLI